MRHFNSPPQCLYVIYSPLIGLLMFLAAFGLSNVTGIRVSGGNFSNDVGQLTSNAGPDLDQIKTWMATYAPLVYFNPNEQYLPSSVNWFFDNGALLYQKGDEANPGRIYSTGSNLPSWGTNDGEFWLDLPVNDNPKQPVIKGNLGTAKGYVHVKPMLNDVTDLAIWLFYPFNGPATVKVEFLNIPLGRIGAHVGDWEHVTLRISNLDGKLQSVFFSQHSGGQWVNASDLEFVLNQNKFIAYASLNGHAMYPHAGLVLQGNTHIGLRNDMAKSYFSLDLGANFEIVSAEYLGIVEPPWLDYFREWGPKFNYSFADELRKVEKYLIIQTLKDQFEKFVNALPPEILGQEGPTGPKEKASWNGDEQEAYLSFYQAPPLLDLLV